MHARGGLGRGLGALIPTAPAEDRVRLATPAAGDGGHRGPQPTASGRALVWLEGVRYADLPVDQVQPNPRQPREVFDAGEMADLVHSVREIGVLQPVVVRPSGPAAYELVMGERRWRACQAAGLATVPAIVRETPDHDLLRDALLENLHRSQLNPLEEAAAYRQLLDDFGCTQEELASRIGRSRPQISNTLRLLRLTAAVQRRVAAGVLSAGHAKALVALGDPAAQERLAARIVAEGLSVRATEEVVALGGEEPPDRKRRGRGARSSLFPEVELRLVERLDTRVRVETSRSRGRIVIEFATPADLSRLADLLDPPAGGAGTPWG